VLPPSVVTDIIFLRKRAPGEPARHQEAEWERSRPFDIDGAEVSINRYFVRQDARRQADLIPVDMLRQLEVQDSVATALAK
jgi:hypothetical protein